MASARGVKPIKVKVQEHRDRLRAQGLRPIQIWVPDVRASSCTMTTGRGLPA